jgi:hypothetical protein
MWVIGLFFFFFWDGAQWRRDVAFAGFEVPIQMDISAEKMIFGVAGIDPARRAELIKVRSCARLLSFNIYVNCFSLHKFLHVRRGYW